MLRVNGLHTVAGLEDVLAVVGSDVQPDFILLPKTDSAAHLQLLDRILTENGHFTLLIGLIESAAALARLDEIAHATPRLAALMLGAADLAADLGCGPESPNLRHARTQLIAACARAQIAALDSPFFDIKDLPSLKRSATEATDMGFVGKAAIHPGQVQTISRDQYGVGNSAQDNGRDG